MRGIAILYGLAALAFATSAFAREGPLASVPFVGCASDGQLGPQAAATKVATPRLPKATAAKLAFYAADGGPGVLAPRGWHCLGLLGSSGATLLVTPKQHVGSEFWAKEAFKTSGPAVEIAYRYGGTSGRWAVAEAIARYFPARRSFIAKNFDGLDIGPLPSGSYTHDLFRKQGDAIVGYETPAGADGAGTSGLLSAGSTPIVGFVMLVEEADGPDLLSLSVRLSRHDQSLCAAILGNARSGAKN